VNSENSSPETSNEDLVLPATPLTAMLSQDILQMNEAQLMSHVANLRSLRKNPMAIRSQLSKQETPEKPTKPKATLVISESEIDNLF
jgi:hypothetical protein